MSDTNNGKVASISGSKGAAVTDNKSVKSGVSVQRRKLIKASAAVVPAIMTLRSGAAAAMTSSANRCLTNPDTRINTTSDIGGIPAVLGDEVPPLPLDEWLRVTARPGMKLMYATGKSNNYKPYYLIRDDNNTSSLWTDIEGWLIYDQDGALKDGGARRNMLGNVDFMTAWSNAVAFYGVDSYPHGLVFIDEYGGDITIPGGVSSAMRTSTTRVYLLAYYNVATGEVTYYPMQQGEALMITGSCLCSINPAFQI